MKKLAIISLLIVSILIVACTPIAQLFGLLIALGVDDLICSQVADISADNNGDGIVDVDMDGDGNVGESDQELYNHRARVFGVCKAIVGFFFNLAKGTVEVHNVETGQWVVLTRMPEQFDLLALEGQQVALTYKENFPVGRYDKLRIDLEKVEIKTRDGNIYPLIIPNKELIFDINMVVEKDSQSSVELNLDLTKSLHATTGGDLVFIPVFDVKSKKNIGIDILNPNKKLIRIRNGVTLETKKYGMDLDGKMKENFVLDKNSKLTLQDGRIITKGTDLVLIQSRPVFDPSNKNKRELRQSNILGKKTSKNIENTATQAPRRTESKIEIKNVRCNGDTVHYELKNNADIRFTLRLIKVSEKDQLNQLRISLNGKNLRRSMDCGTDTLEAGELVSCTATNVDVRTDSKNILKTEALVGGASQIAVFKFDCETHSGEEP